MLVNAKAKRSKKEAEINPKNVCKNYRGPWFLRMLIKIYVKFFIHPNYSANKKIQFLIAIFPRNGQYLNESVNK